MSKQNEWDRLLKVVRELGDLARDGLRMGVARRVPGATLALALMRHGSVGENPIVQSESVARALRDDLRRVAASSASELAYLLAPLDAMLDTPGSRCVWEDPNRLVDGDYTGVHAALSEACVRARAARDAEPISRDPRGLPRVCLHDAGLGRWYAASVLRVTPKQVKLQVDNEGGERVVVLKRERHYPQVGGGACDVDERELDIILAGKVSP